MVLQFTDRIEGYIQYALYHLRVSACVVIVFGDNLGKRLGYGLWYITDD